MKTIATNLVCYR